jgi:tetratricopeptide (TPR) repeat protein
MGITLTKLGRIPEANDEYNAAIRLNPRLADPHRMGVNYWTLSLAPLAEQEFQAAHKLAPADEFAHYGLGLVYLAANRDASSPASGRAGPVLAQDVDAMLDWRGTWLQSAGQRPANVVPSPACAYHRQEYQLAVFAGSMDLDRTLAIFKIWRASFPALAA